jgi:hypothetical protein
MSTMYRELLARLDRWMDEGRRVPRRHPAAPGAACHGPFDVTVADVE